MILQKLVTTYYLMVDQGRQNCHAIYTDGPTEPCTAAPDGPPRPPMAPQMVLLGPSVVLQSYPGKANN